MYLGRSSRLGCGVVSFEVSGIVAGALGALNEVLLFIPLVGFTGEVASGFLFCPIPLASFIQPKIPRELRRLCSLLVAVTGRWPAPFGIFDSVKE